MKINIYSHFTTQLQTMKKYIIFNNSYVLKLIRKYLHVSVFESIHYIKAY